MALIVEDGTGKVDAESYGSVAEATDYHAKFGNAAWAAAELSKQEIALRTATAYMVATLRGSWPGYRTVSNQALDHPRVDLWRDEYDQVPFNVVASEVKLTCFDLALIVLSGASLYPATSARTKKSIKVGPIAVTYDGDGPVGPAFAAAMMRLGPLLAPGAASGHMIELQRG